MANGMNRFFRIALQGSDFFELTESMFHWQFFEEAASFALACDPHAHPFLSEGVPRTSLGMNLIALLAQRWNSDEVLFHRIWRQREHPDQGLQSVSRIEAKVSFCQ